MYSIAVSIATSTHHSASYQRRKIMCENTLESCDSPEWMSEWVCTDGEKAGKGARNRAAARYTQSHAQALPSKHTRRQAKACRREPKTSMRRYARLSAQHSVLFISYRSRTPKTRNTTENIINVFRYFVLFSSLRWLFSGSFYVCVSVYALQLLCFGLDIIN